MAEETNEAPAAEPSAPESGGGGGNKLVMILTIVNLLSTLGIGGVVFMSLQKEKAKPSVDDIAATAEHGEEAKGGEHGGGHGEAKKDDGHGGGGEHGKKPGRPSDFGKMITLESFTVNLSSSGSTSPKFARVDISVEVPSDDVESEVTVKMPQVRNTIIDIFNSKRTTDLATPDGRQYIKEEILNGLNSFMMKGKIKGVFFTNFALSS